MQLRNLEQLEIAHEVKFVSGEMSDIDAIDPIDKERREKVKEAMLHAWNSYEKHAWGQDELQIDPPEKLDPEVEDVLVEIADDFIKYITTFGCSLSKNKKSTTLEAKDILLHVINEIHKEWLAVILDNSLLKIESVEDEEDTRNFFTLCN